MHLPRDHGEMKPADIQGLFPCNIKNPALRSHLTVLAGKGQVTRRNIGKAYFYRAVTPRQTAFRSMLREPLDNYCGGSVQSLRLNLIQTEKLSTAELLEIERLAKGDRPSEGQRRKS